MIKFSIPLEPKAQERVRFTKKGGRYKSANHKRNEKNLKDMLRMVANTTVMPIKCSDRALILNVECYFKRPKSHFKSNGELKKSAPKYHVVKPDFDNLMKMICDCMTGIFLKDDKQIIEGNLLKKYGKNTRWEVEILEKE